MNRGKKIQFFGFVSENVLVIRNSADFSLIQDFLCSLEMLVSVEKLFRLSTILEKVFLKSKYCMESFNRVVRDFVETRKFSSSKTSLKL